MRGDEENSSPPVDNYTEDVFREPDKPASIVAPDGTTTRNETQRKINLIFEHWKSVMQHPDAKLDDKRRSVILKQLKNYSVEQLCQAITGCSFTPHNMGINKSNQRYDDLGLIFRDAAHVEGFIRNFQKPPRSGLTETTIKNIQAGQDFLREVMEEEQAFSHDGRVGGVENARDPCR